LGLSDTLATQVQTENCYLDLHSRMHDFCFD
jgi:hypothetical protein